LLDFPPESAEVKRRSSDKGETARLTRGDAPCHLRSSVLQACRIVVRATLFLSAASVLRPPCSGHSAFWYLHFALRVARPARAVL